MSDTATSAQTSGVRKWFTPRQITGLVLGLIVVLVVAGALWWAFLLMGKTQITATFARTVGLYQGSDVRMLGVPVGKIDSVEPDGETVKVVMSVDRGVDLPADVRAVQVIPSVVADRYVQLTPAYTGGEKAGRDITLSLDQTMVPVEVDDLYESVRELSEALGPEGVNNDGALSELLATGAENLKGNGERLGAAFEQLSRASTTLSDSSGNLVDTIKNLNVFVGALRENDTQVRQFNSQMASFNSFLADERDQLGTALRQISLALGDVANFVADHQDALGQTLQDLQPTTEALRDNRDHLKEVLTVLPVALSNLVNAYDAESGMLAMRINIPELQDVIGAQCRLLDVGQLLPGNPQAGQISAALRPLISQCRDLGEQITEGVLEPVLPILPFGIMDNQRQQQGSVPGTPRANPNPELERPTTTAPVNPAPSTPAGGN